MYMTMTDGVGKYCVTKCVAPNILQTLDDEHDVLCMTVSEATQYIAAHSAVVVKNEGVQYFLECEYYSVDPQGENKHESGAFIAPDGIKCRDSCIANHQAYKRFVMGINIYKYCQDCGDSEDRIYESQYTEGRDEIMCVDRCLSTFNSYDTDEHGRYYCAKCN